jgi:hypothetical protein
MLTNTQVEFKAIPLTYRPNAVPPSPGADPRTGSVLILFEEFVPAEYRTQLANVGQSTKRKLNFLNFSLGKSSSKAWKPATTLNGKPYTPGAVPWEAEFRSHLTSTQ